MNAEEAKQMTERLKNYNQIQLDLGKIGEVLKWIDNFRKKDYVHEVAAILIDPNCDELRYASKNPGTKIGHSICCLSEKQNRDFCKAFFIWAREYFEAKRAEAEAAAGEA